MILRYTDKFSFLSYTCHFSALAAVAMFNVPRTPTVLMDQPPDQDPNLSPNTSSVTHQEPTDNENLVRQPVPPSIPLPHSHLTLNVGQGQGQGLSLNVAQGQGDQSASAPSTVQSKPPSGSKRGSQRGQLRSRPLHKGSDRSIVNGRRNSLPNQEGTSRVCDFLQVKRFLT